MPGDNDHGREPSRIITNPNIMFGRGRAMPGGSPGQVGFSAEPLTLQISIPPEQEEKVRKTLQELSALAKELDSQLTRLMEKFEILEKKRDALHLEEST